MAAPVLVLASLFVGALRADVRTLVDEGKISWSGIADEANNVIYLDAAGNSATSANYAHVVLRFTDTNSVGTLTILDDVRTTARLLLVGGGGGGCGRSTSKTGAGGGGGAGGFVDIASTTFRAGVYSVTVGAGGAGGVVASGGTEQSGGNGTSSLLATNGVSLYEAAGGGGGGARSVGANGANSLGGAGSSGGGGSRTTAFASGNRAGGAGGTDGHAGGAGNMYHTGGGGGGAGGAGGPAETENIGGTGGDGLSSDITGATLWYAGGGGGGTREQTNTANLGAGGQGGGGRGGSGTINAQAGAANTGGGGGGGNNTNVDSLPRQGGDGGSGVVIIHLLEAVAEHVAVPVLPDMPYTGENIVAPILFGMEYAYDGGDTNATTAGTYTLSVRPGAGCMWITGGDHATNVTWTITPRQIDKPTPRAGLVYDGTDKVGLDVSADCLAYATFADGSVTNATNGGTYRYSVALNDTVNTIWSDGTTAPVLDATWTIDPKKVAVPEPRTGLVFDNTVQQGFDALALDDYDLIMGETSSKWGGEHQYVFKLRGNATATNRVWDVTNPLAKLDNVLGSWTIAAAANEITHLSLKGWKIGATPNTPDITATWGAGVPYDIVEYTYGFGATAAAVTRWYDRDDPAAFNDPGGWIVRAIVPATESWAGATNTAAFSLWTDPANTYRDWTEITVKARAGATETLTNFPVCVRISETRLPGFSYARAGDDGRGLAFSDDDGNILPYEVDTWNASGESIVWVRLATLPPGGTTITMYWNLREGLERAAYTPAAVWTNYVVVVHGGTGLANSVNNGLAVQAGSTSVRASADAATGVVGGGIEKQTNNSIGLDVSNPSAKLADSGRFAVSGWFRRNGDGADTGNVGTQFFAASRTGWNSSNGFTFHQEKNQYISVSSNNKHTWQTAGATLADLTWGHVAFSYDETAGRNVVLYVNGTQDHEGTAGGTLVSTATWWSFGSYAHTANNVGLKGEMDELRIYNGVPSAEWIQAEYLTADASFTTNGAVYHDNLKINTWAVAPQMDKTSWLVGQSAGTVTNTPAFVYGTVSTVIYDVYDTNVTFASTADITAAGYYRIRFEPVYASAEEAATFEPFVDEIDLRVIIDASRTDIGGTTGDSGRVLLMNNHIGDSIPNVDYQGWYDADNAGAQKSNTTTFWHHENLTPPSVSYNLQNGTESTLWTQNYGRRLWHLVNCRHGNTFPANDSEALDTAANKVRNFLPYRATYSRDITSHRSRGGQVSATRKQVGQLVMLNTTEAVVYSSCLTNGIGTIYFDAVNGWCRTGENAEDYETYRLVVEVATNTVEGLEPTDLNCETRTDIVDPGTGDITGVVETNWYGNLPDSCWHAAKILPFLRDGTPDFVALAATNELTLAVTNGGTMANFYRVAIPVDYSGPVRFRIRRTAENVGPGAEATSFILLDNILVSIPAMRGDLVSAGHFDATKKGSSTLGWELATSVPYPSVADTSDTGLSSVTARATPVYTVTALDPNADTNTFFLSAVLHYRWRYLNQDYGDEQTVDLNPGDNFRSVVPLNFPARPCDIEYWFEYNLQAPYYKYTDYSGLGAGVPYSESRGTLTNALAATSRQASAGTDWFFRVRAGKSPHASMRVAYRRGNATTTEYADAALVADGTWRAFVQTRDNQAGALAWRVEALDRRDESESAYVPTTNHWRCTTADLAIPVSDELTPCAEDDWSTITLDAVTGYVMFQIDDAKSDAGKMPLTIVHADYQDVNGWTDAYGRKYGDHPESIFVGTSSTNAYKTGVSPVKQTFEEDFGTWLDMPATNGYWTFPQAAYTMTNLYGRTAYETFSSDTNGLWAVGQGMWVAKEYRNNGGGAGVALQMEGNGKGYLQFTDDSNAPRGLESISFNARLGQFIRFNDFAYYYGEAIAKMKGYTFMTRAAFDLEENAGFKGNASLSLVANYRPDKGCYEARWEWIGTNIVDAKGKAVANCKGQRLCLYRWNMNSDGTTTDTLLCAWTNTVFTPQAVTALANNANQLFTPYFISVSNMTDRTWVLAGVCPTGIQLGTPLTAGTDGWKDTTKWRILRYCDTDSAKRLKTGTYGVLSANSAGVFARPQILRAPLSEVNDNTAQTAELAVKITSSQWKECSSDFHKSSADEELDWSIIPGRMKATYENEHVNAIEAAPVAQKLQIYLGTKGRADFGSTPYTTIDLDSFGSRTFTNNLYATKDCSVRFAVAGSIADVRTDVVVDSVTLRQWRGGEWNDTEVLKSLPSWATHDAAGNIDGLTNFVFTSAWITNNTILLSAKRANLTTPSSIRSPLMDGEWRNGEDGDGSFRGKGLGMLSISYANAQANAALALQVATNGVSTGNLNSFDKSFDEAVWDTIATTNFSTMSAPERAGGVLNWYLGFHDVKGIMRIVIPTNTIVGVQGETDPSNFGDVTITKIVCRDEPALDVRCWWGWNLRTLGGDDDTEKRMLLDDYSSEAGGAGLSLALNNSISSNFAESLIDVGDIESYKVHKPFVQTPTFSKTNIVGEVAFKARKYSPSDEDAAIVLYGSKDADETHEGTWTKIAAGTFWVTNAWYETYTYKTDPGEAYCAFRLAVAGVSGVQDLTGGGNGKPDGAGESWQPKRVLLDELLVCEAIRPRVGFQNVGCFRSDMAGTDEVPNVPGEEEQPLCDEAWGVQCEIYGAQLPGEIDLSRAQVFLHWFEGDDPWGYENWKNYAGHRSAALSRTTDSTDGHWVYRSSQRTSPGAVIGLSHNPTCVQYMLEVRFYTVGGSEQMTNWMTVADWKVPKWYNPVDYNADPLYGKGKSFAAFNLLDNVAPHWAWINEVNIIGDIDSNWNNTDENMQYVEIVQPLEADISGWSVRLLEAQEGSHLVLTNVLATFGDELPGTKDPKYGNYAQAPGKVFRVIGSPNSSSIMGGELDYDNGTLDSVWYVPEEIWRKSQTITKKGVIAPFESVALQLVRASGIVEHEIVVKGTNLWEDLGVAPETYPANVKAYLEKTGAGTDFVLPGYDNHGDPYSLSVTNGFGLVSNNWNNAALKTPGAPNDGQTIGMHRLPGGESVLIYFMLADDHVQQWNGETFTNAMLMTSVPKGDPFGTNITYQVKEWYVIGDVTTNDVSALALLGPPTATQPRQYVLSGVGKSVSNNLVVVASSTVDPRLATEWDVPEDDPYRPAIIDWLEHGTDIYGNPFKDIASGEIHLAEFRTLNNTFVTNLTLREMYWLDMDPTAGQLVLIGGSYMPPPGESQIEHVMTTADGTTVTNVRVGVHLMITNESASAAIPATPRGPNDFGTHWTPYVLRGLEPQSNSITADLGRWSSVTFKMTGRILNGYTSPTKLANWVPLRLFVFRPDSFEPSGLARVEVWDPHDELSIGHWEFVPTWEEDAAAGRPLSKVYYYWSIDTRQRQAEIEVLQPRSYNDDP